MVKKKIGFNKQVFLPYYYSKLRITLGSLVGESSDVITLGDNTEKKSDAVALSHG